MAAMKMNRTKWSFLLVALLLVVVVLAVLSTGESVIGDGGFPPCELQLTVLDENQKPVPNARVDIVGVSGSRATDYPFIEETERGDLRTDKDGKIMLHQVRTGLQFGFQRHSIAGIVISESGGTPQYEIRITCPGYKNATIDADELLVSAWGSEKTRFPVREAGGTREVELNVVRRTTVLTPR